MTRTVHCVKLDRELPALERPPYPGELGQRILERVSAEAWQGWLAQQTMLINENHLSPRKAEHRRYLEQQMEAYFFGDGGDKPVGFIPVAKP